MQRSLGNRAVQRFLHPASLPRRNIRSTRIAQRRILRRTAGSRRRSKALASTGPGWAKWVSSRTWLLYNFDINRSNLKSEHKTFINQLLPNIKGAAKVKLTGHASRAGRPARNVRLSKARAEKVAAYLKQRGVPAGRIETIGLGEKTAAQQGAPDRSERSADRAVSVSLHGKAPAATRKRRQRPRYRIITGTRIRGGTRGRTPAPWPPTLSPLERELKTVDWNKLFRRAAFICCGLSLGRGLKSVLDPTPTPPSATTQKVLKEHKKCIVSNALAVLRNDKKLRYRRYITKAIVERQFKVWFK